MNKMEKRISEYEEVVSDIFSIHYIFERYIVDYIDCYKGIIYLVSKLSNGINIFENSVSIRNIEIEISGSKFICRVIFYEHNKVEVKLSDIYDVAVFISHALLGVKDCKYCSVKIKTKEFKECLGKITYV